MKNYSVAEYAKVARQVVAESIVLLKNDDNVLPIKKNTKVALFGRSQFNYYKSGTGSGGMVNAKYVVGINDALEGEDGFCVNQNLKKIYADWIADHPFDYGMGWAMEPWFQEEMPLTDELILDVKNDDEVAVIIIGRTAGEDKDSKTEEGSIYLTKTEEDMLERVCRIYDKTIVLLNVGNIIDMKWVEKYNPSSVLYVWQGGQEGGNGVLDVLNGTVSPSGKLSDTIAFDINDYPSTSNFGDDNINYYEEDIYVGYRYFTTFAPEKVQYPFGFGLSYTSFAAKASFSLNDKKVNADTRIGATIEVTNTGDAKGKSVQQIYAKCPQGKLGKPNRSLIGYIKTKELDKGESETITINIPVKELASYDDRGVTGNESCFVLEDGTYEIYLGDNSRDNDLVFSFSIEENIICEQLEEACRPTKSLNILIPGEFIGDQNIYEQGFVNAPLRSIDPMDKRNARLPKELSYTGDKGYKLSDVKSGKVTMDDFIAQLSDEELSCIVRGEGMCSLKVTPGTASAFGGVTDALHSYGIPIGCCSDGPSGIRMDCGTIAFSLPNGTAIASTFNDDLIEELFEYLGLELRKNHIETILGPGMNIHRNPLNGRNFEYFSEDPLLTGKMAVAELTGLHKYGVTGTIKHFAANNQEHRRHFTDSVVSERALREIYFKGFEMAVKQGKAKAIMTTYGSLNGIWTAGNYDLVTAILHDQWGFTGIVMTDWWAKINDEGEEATVKNTSAMVRSQNDLYMVTEDSITNANDDNSLEGLKNGKVSRADFQRCAKNICNFLLDTPAYLRENGIETELDKALAIISSEEAMEVGESIKVTVDNKTKCTSIDIAEIPTQTGDTTNIEAFIPENSKGRVEIECRAADYTPDLAQLPITVFCNGYVRGTITLVGTQKEWVTRSVAFESEAKDSCYIKLFFGLTGIELNSVKIIIE